MKNTIYVSRRKQRQTWRNLGDAYTDAEIAVWWASVKDLPWSPFQDTTRFVTRGDGRCRASFIEEQDNG